MNMLERKAEHQSRPQPQPQPHCAADTEALAGPLPTEAINDAARVSQEANPIAALDALARCMADGALGG